MKKNVNKIMKSNDLKFGKNNEVVVQGILERHFGEQVNKYRNKFSTFDYYIENKKKKITDIIELKSRRANIGDYDTQLIGLNKINKGIEQMKKGIKIWLCFHLNDGTYIYNLHKDHKFKTCMLGNFARNDKADELCLIPNSYLTKINFPNEPIVVNFD